MGSEMCIRGRRPGLVDAVPLADEPVVDPGNKDADDDDDDQDNDCLLYTSDAADERSSVDLGGRRIIKKKTQHSRRGGLNITIYSLHRQTRE